MVELEEYQHLQSQRPNMKKADFLSRLSENTPFETEAELESWIKKTEAEIKRKQRKDQGLDDEPEEEPSFPMVDRPDEELNEDELREKKKQRLMKAGWEARVKIRAEKQRERERVEEEKRQEESERLRDPEGWALKLKEEQEVGHPPCRESQLTFRLSFCVYKRGRRRGHSWETESLLNPKRE